VLCKIEMFNTYNVFCCLDVQLYDQTTETQRLLAGSHKVRHIIGPDAINRKYQRAACPFIARVILNKVMYSFNITLRYIYTYLQCSPQRIEIIKT